MSFKEECLVLRLAELGWHITTAESCTGGQLAAAIVNVPGASEVFEQGFITYSDAAKHRLLGVSRDTLESFTAVSRETAAEMVLGAARASVCEVALATTGLAGPGGGTPERPVGLVYLACCVQGRVTVQEHHFPGDRGEVRCQAVAKALELALSCIER